MIQTDNNKKVTSREQDFSAWYQDIVEIADLAEHGPVKGTMIIRPYGYSIWENIQKTLDARFKELGVENVYFPMFIPESFLKKEESHIEGFSPEVAVVTHAGGKELAETLIVRPTSETIMYSTFANWIQSYKNLPLVINQWANVVRWEMRPRLFLRTTEFLWQEGHTAHETFEEADQMAIQMLNVYKDFAQEYLAIPVIPGAKSESEKFAGAFSTYCLECMMQDGKALQFSTSHNLGQNFAKAFDIKFLSANNNLEYVWQTSWGLSTRVIGGLIMVHSDDIGLVLPPKIAPIQAVVLPIWNKDLSRNKAIEAARALSKNLNNFRIKIDESDELKTGEKYYFWEKRGVPIRIELGPKDISNQTALLVRRDTGEKIVVPFNEIASKIEQLLVEIQKNLFEKALKLRNSKIVEVATFEEFEAAIDAGNFAVAYWDGTKETEATIKEKTKATIRCIPFDWDSIEYNRNSVNKSPGTCVLTGKNGAIKVIFARAY